MRHSVAIISLSVVAFSSLVGCGLSYQSSVNVTGAILGWDHHLYKLTSPINSIHMGKKLGIVTYHGSVAGVFTIFQVPGSSPAKDVFFEKDGHYYKAVVTKSN